jgi:hypothetical protein
MDYVLFTLQLIAGFGIYNVWLLRFNQSTRYRGGEASSLKDEFTEYGLPGAKMYLIGFLKLGSATGLIIGCFIPSLVVPSAALLALLMLGALIMHLKVKDPFARSVPALIMLALCLSILFLSLA